ncbi:MAG: hypothetical protein OXL97_01805 [Chloroflexota bacterium]|nr:hypothetical protein [Chloroflexota bacterium]MDE2886473.1 hypothetical protein [Chloroflexota bacterium]
MSASRALLSVSAGALVLLALLLALAAGAVALAQSSTDYDADDDGLIEVASLAQLNAIRWDLDGDGTPASANASDYSSAFPNAATGMGCPQAGCTGYELAANLDFDTNGDGSTNVAGDAYWNDGAGWEPIGTESESFSTTFEGNDNTIVGLFINRPAADRVGLFGVVSNTGGVIRNVGLTNTNVTGRDWVGGLVGENWGTISASYSTGGGLAGDPVFGFYVTYGARGNSAGGLVGRNYGTITASYSTSLVWGGEAGGLVSYSEGTIVLSYATGGAAGESGSRVGGLVGSNNGTVSASYATGPVSNIYHAEPFISSAGGLVGSNDPRGTISASYATGAVSGPADVGGLVALNFGTIEASYATGGVSYTRQGGPVGSDDDVGGLVGTVGASYRVPTTTSSYWDTQTTGQSTSDGGVGKTTSELQSPTGYTGIYADWNVDLDGDGDGDDPWDFGTSSEIRSSTTSRAFSLPPHQPLHLRQLLRPRPRQSQPPRPRPRQSQPPRRRRHLQAPTTTPMTTA